MTPARKAPGAAQRTTRTTPAPPPRIRRSAAESRTAILDAAERRLVVSGPAAIRLQEVAADVGVSHPTVLHHFGSRERLVAEVVQRRIDHMNAEVLGAVASGAAGHEVVEPLLTRLFDVFGPGGHARVVAFLALDGATNPSLDGLRPLARALHARRSLAAPPGPKPTVEDSDFIVQLTAFALFGEAIAGPLFRGEDPAAPDTKARARFLAGLVRLIETLLPPAGSAVAAAPPARRSAAKARSAPSPRRSKA